MRFHEADYFNALNGNQFIADLMPKHPVYTAMLDDSARAVIGLPHPTGRAAMRMLEAEGFAYEGYVDIFDGGPTMTARTDQIVSIRNAFEANIVSVSAVESDHPVLIATGLLAAFRCCCGFVKKSHDGVDIDRESAALLDLRAGDHAWVVDR